MALSFMKGRTEDKVMIASGAVTPTFYEPGPTLTPGLVIVILVGLIFAVATVVMVTAPFWFLHS